MTQPDPNVVPEQPVQQPAEVYPQQAVEPGGDLPNVGTHDTQVEGTFAGAGQPTVAVEDQQALGASSPLDENYQGLVSIKYNGDSPYTDNGFYIEPGETKTLNASQARLLLTGGNGSFEVV